MMRFILVFIFLPALIFSCSPGRQIKTATQTVTKTDTTPVIAATDNKKVDSSALVKEIYNKVIKNKIDFKTFTARARMGYKGNEGGEEATVYIRLRKDSALWLSLRGPLGIEGFRVLITRDSVMVMDLLKKNIILRDISFLNQLTGFPFDFSTLQDLVIGNAVFTDPNIIGHTITNNGLAIMMRGERFRNLLTIDTTDFKMLHSRVEEVNTQTNRSCDLDFSGYDNKAGVPFSTTRKITVVQQAKMDISVEIKEYSFNQAITFPFNIQNNYKRL